MSLRKGLLASAAATASLLGAAAACGSPAPGAAPVKNCAWQCRGPYELDVTFRLGTTRQAAMTAMKPCQADPIVIKIGPPKWHPALDRWIAVILTKTMGARAQPAPGTPPSLITCLRQSPSIESEGWPV